jgi:hypothetical protein
MMRLLWIAGLASAVWAKSPGVTFSHDIAPILYRHCAGCHHANGGAPFPLVAYAEAAARAQLIAAVTANRSMPPWLPAAPHFANERRLSAAEIALFQQWATEGAAEGNPAETPVAPQFAVGWTSGKPDLEAGMPNSFAVPADGPDLYRCFVIPLPRQRVRYVRTIEIRPGSPKVVHHALLFQDPSGQARKRDTGAGYDCFGTPGFLPARGLGGWTPGAPAVTMLPGMAETLYAGADLVLQVHYHPTGKPENDRTSVALYFTGEKPQRHLVDVGLASNRIDIPAGYRNYKVTDHFEIPVDVDVMGIIPHAHYVCKNMLGYAVLPDGTKRTLLNIPEWNFNWQDQYRYPVPIRLPAGTRIEMEYTYDNSEANPRNPSHPPRRVVYGPGSTDEMAGLHLEVAPAQESDLEELSQALWGRMMRALGGGSYRRGN